MSRRKRFGGIAGLGVAGVLVVVVAALMVGGAGASIGCPATSLEVTSATSTVAGDVLVVTVEARNGTCRDVDYAGEVGFTSSDGQAELPGNYTFSPAGDEGVAQFDVTLKTAVTAAATVTATDTSNPLVTGTQAGITVEPGPLDHFELSGVPASQAAGAPFSVTAKAFDAYGNLKTNYDSPAAAATLGGLSTSPGCAACDPLLDAQAPSYGALTFTDGEASASVTAYATGLQSLTVIDGLVNAGQSVDVTPAALGGFAFDAAVPTPQTAGASFGVSVTAYDLYGNPKTNYAGGAGLSGTLGTSPGCGGCSPALPALSPSYGSLAWTGATATASVTAFRAETGRALSVTDGSVSNTSSVFTVDPTTLEDVTFADSPDFDGQPVDSETATPIYHFCKPPDQPSTPPCATTTMTSPSTAVSVLAVDRYGNPLQGQSVSIAYRAAGSVAPATPLSGASAGLTGADGTTSFGDSLVIGTVGNPALLGNYELVATSGSASASSSTFQLVADLVACGSTVCVSTASSGKHYAYGRLNAQQDSFDPSATLLTNQFLSNSIGNCSGTYKQVLTQDTEVRPLPQLGLVELRSTLLTTTIAIIIPKSTLQSSGYSSRNVNAFQVCTGAQWIAPLPAGSAWLAKQSPTSSTLVPSVEADGYYWGWTPDCSALTAAQKATGNPCVAQRTKNADQLGAALGLGRPQVAALPFKSSDFAVVVTMGYPWDGRLAGP